MFALKCFGFLFVFIWVHIYEILYKYYCKEGLNASLGYLFLNHSLLLEMKLFRSVLCLKKSASGDSWIYKQKYLWPPFSLAINKVVLHLLVKVALELEAIFISVCPSEDSNCLLSVWDCIAAKGETAEEFYKLKGFVTSRQEGGTRASEQACSELSKGGCQLKEHSKGGSPEQSRCLCQLTGAQAACPPSESSDGE